MDLWTEEFCRSFRSLIFIGQFVHPVGGELRVHEVIGWIGVLASWEYHCTRVHENFVQYPSKYISIDIQPYSMYFVYLILSNYDFISARSTVTL